MDTKKLEDWGRADFDKLFKTMQNYQKNGLSAATALIDRSLAAVGFIQTASFDEATNNKIIQAYHAWVKDAARTQAWAVLLGDLAKFQVRVVWTSADYVSFLVELEKLLFKEGMYRNSKAYIGDKYIDEVMLTMPKQDRKNCNGQFRIDMKTAFQAWVLNKTTQSWKANLTLHPSEALSKEDIERYNNNLANPQVVRKIQFVSKEEMQQLSLPVTTPAATPKAPAPASQASAPAATPPATEHVQTQGTLALGSLPSKGDPTPEAMSAAMHYMEKALTSAFTKVVEAIKQPQPLAHFATISKFSFKLPKQALVPMTKIHVPVVRVQMPDPLPPLAEHELRSWLHREIDAYFNDGSNGGDSNDPKAQGGRPTAGADLLEFEGKLKSFQELRVVTQGNKDQEVKPIRVDTRPRTPKPPTEPVRRLDIVVLGMQNAQLNTVSKGLPDYVKFEAFWDWNNQARNRLKTADWIYVMKKGGHDRMDVIKAMGFFNKATWMGEKGASTIRSLVIELIDRNGWSDDLEGADRTGPTTKVA